MEEKEGLHLGNSTGFLSILDFTAWPGRLALFVWEAVFVFMFVVAYGSSRAVTMSYRLNLCVGGETLCIVCIDGWWRRFWTKLAYHASGVQGT